MANKSNSNTSAQRDKVVSGSLLDTLSGVECTQKKSPNKLCGDRTLVGKTAKRDTTEPPRPVKK